MATTLNAQIQALAEQVGIDIKTIFNNQGDLDSLTTAQKASLVRAINELKANIDLIDKNIIDDAQTVGTKTWSSNKIATEISAKCQEVKDALLGGAGNAYDTLKELADLITANKDTIESLQQLAGSHIRYDTAQELNPTQQSQARSNMNAASATELGNVGNLQTTEKTNVVGAINEVVSVANAAKSTAEAAQSTANAANTKAGQVETSLNEFKGQVGETDTDFVAIYTAARDGTSE